MEYISEWYDSEHVKSFYNCAVLCMYLSSK